MKDNKAYYQRRYSLRYLQRKTTGSVEVTFPFDVVSRKAREKGLTVDEFIKEYQAVANYNGFDGVLYTFEKRAVK